MLGHTVYTLPLLEGEGGGKREIVNREGEVERRRRDVLYTHWTTHAVSRCRSALWALSFLSTNAHRAERDGLVCDPVSIGIDVSGVKCNSSP